MEAAFRLSELNGKKFDPDRRNGCSTLDDLVGTLHSGDSFQVTAADFDHHIRHQPVVALEAHPSG